MAVAIVILLIALGSIAFHFWSPWWWTPIASNWQGMDDTILLTFWITGFVFVAICAFVAYCVWKYRYQKNRIAEYKPEDKKLETRLILITTLGVIALLAPGLLVWNNYISVPDNAYKVEVVAYQWGWKFRLPGKDGVLGKTDIKLINDENPFGLNLEDSYGKDDLLVDEGELHLLLDRPVKFELRAIDVLHNFYVPQFRGKMDMVPGMITYYWITPTRIGEFEILCAEYCGTGHYAMRGLVIVDKEKEYNKWEAKQITFDKMFAKNKNNKNLQLAKNTK
ncbi:MAG: cytochrome c oxidase subunit II [Pelagibacteraceae bacterium]|jgi:cytochrome c oxidase subunit 2|uniref:cytochrome-c oxidase n=1 Tax=marine metagenome TaxID=408172 RepID=A0A381SVZ2_9ZZZZ|nr:cytochrome c oxidase subunit II [Pelagibacteraceae bacterium]MBO6481769.1 cytochrome c oxidase subunit II [Pelagibacteraceae bacterium]MBO6483725.1 cytochrome c oxidase subunit II [Pelagibacteraceae bacterium]MBO6484841.1 cytochrome c oxidase subunit II [Pelagibacteraceae bacterium]MBO6486708.1 cytochrome c oxidase subunit II [Pelagibacteraceae bacterium]|tara:strand:+ start:145 stop:981 length:837 start_codon:yes stop_codon:yes gene_type:complete